MRLLPLAAACAAAALAVPAAPASAVAGPAVAAVTFEGVNVSPPRLLAGFCSWDGAVLVGWAQSLALSPTDAALDINVRCTLYDRYGNVVASVHEGSAGPPVYGVAVASPTTTLGRLCGSVNAYYRGGSLSDCGCATPVP